MTDIPRMHEMTRRTGETEVFARLDLDGRGTAEVATGIGFLDHLITCLAKHARFDIVLRCAGDLVVDDHHSAEDCALLLGSCLDACLGDRRGIQRFGHAYAPLDESLARCVVDLSGRPGAYVTLGLKRERIGAIACENITHFFQSLAIASRSTVHLDLLRGDNDHHRAESACKALALALRAAVTRSQDPTDVPSTKGVLS